jgi:predicted nucleic acid-binding protein
MSGPFASDPNTNWRPGQASKKCVLIHYFWRPQLRDPSDEMVLETAVNGRANLLITFNVRDYGTGPARFLIEVMTPREAVERISK